ncbi:MAG: tRNA (adenosine(37)-N6)-dimethylallyltransferase MiaA [Verrucomicrobia bacterium]|nr:tRNA (adenosine(37)-N6)-dimethylallyltransferase MiaA [Verrucomicrobiota bacterium]
MSAEPAQTPLPVFIAGPTASGKSALALALAERLNGEIISVDSMQVYRGLDIGTAKPTPAERDTVRHHLIDVAELSEPFDAAKFCELARAATSEIQARGKAPIFCGGTGLYFKAFLEGLGEAPPSDEQLRTELEQTPLEELLRELQSKDPITFEQVDRQNSRRVVRALEVIRLTGKPFSEQRSAWQKTTEKKPAPNFFGLQREPADLHERINRRVDQMFAKGLVVETERLLKAGLDQNKTAMQAIGYRQVVEHLRGERNLPETVDVIKIKTRQYAKRQMTWFRGQFELQWLVVGQDKSIQQITETIGSVFVSRKGA